MTEQVGFWGVIVLMVSVAAIFFASLRRKPADSRDDHSSADHESPVPSGATWVKPPLVTRTYPVALVGEQHYQAAIGRCRAGDPVRLLLEPDNPYDPNAIVAVTEAGEALGYLPRDSWLRDALLDEGKGYTAEVREAVGSAKGFVEVTLTVALAGEPLGERAFVPAG